MHYQIVNKNTFQKTNIDFQPTKRMLMAYGYTDYLEVPIELYGKEVEVVDGIVVEKPLDFNVELQKIKDILEENNKNALISERQIGNYYFTLEDSFRVMIKSDIDSAREFGITQTSGIKDLKGTTVKCSLDDAQLLYKQLWIENKLIYITYMTILGQLIALEQNKELPNEEKLIILQQIPLTVDINPEQVAQIIAMTAEELNQFVQSLG